jgi:hypothetical protein
MLELPLAELANVGACREAEDELGVDALLFVLFRRFTGKSRKRAAPSAARRRWPLDICRC